MTSHTKTISIFVAIVATIAFTSPARADQETKLPDNTRAVMSLRTGLDSAMAMTAGYARRLAASPTERDYMLFGALTLPAGNLDLGDSLLEFGSSGMALRHEQFGLQLSLSTTLRNTQTSVFAANALGTQVALLPGYRGKRWGVVGEVSYEKILATHLRQSTLYTDLIYQRAKSGWYRGSAGTLRAGARVGVRVDKVEIGVQVGLQWTESGNPTLPPFYGTLGASFAM